MQEIWKVLEHGRAKVNAHPFFSWLASDTVPLTSRFIFSPVMIDFIMSFADLNKWFLRYENPEGTLQLSINEHTDEDATHSRLFVQNWGSLKLGDTLDWPASKGLWWLFHSPHCHAVRHFGMDVLKLAVNLTDPRVRFCLMEAIEICGDVFFEGTAPVAEVLEQQGLGQHIYYGQYHRDRETGHLQTDEGCFAEAKLSDEQRARGEAAIDIVYEHFLGVLDQLLAFCQQAVSDYRGLQSAIERDYRAELTPPTASTRAEPRHPRNADGSNAQGDQQFLLDRLESRMDRLRGHSFLAWLKDGRVPPVQRLQAFTPLWGIDIVGYKDFNDLVLRYPKAQSPAERSVNRLAHDLASHGALYLQDWKALRLDQVLGWRMVDVIKYYFLSDDTEVHRRNMAKVKKLAMRHDNPLVRWWLMFALERANQVLLESTREAALAAEDELGITLNYWAYRHGLTESSGDEEEFAFLAQPLTNDEVAIIAQVLETVFDNFEEQFDLSQSVSRSGIFSIQPTSLPPPRVSDVVMRAPADFQPKWIAGVANG